MLLKPLYGLWFQTVCASHFQYPHTCHRRGNGYPPHPWWRSSTPRPTPLRHQPSCADQPTPSPVEEGLDLHLPYQQHIWRLASINTVCAWRLPSKTALHQRPFLRLKRSEGKKNKQKKKTNGSETRIFFIPGGINFFWGNFLNVGL